MRTTITLDDDVSKKIDEYIKRTGKSAKDVFNELLRAALVNNRRPRDHKSFKLRLFKGKTGLMPGFSWDMSTADILDRLDEESLREKT